MKPTTTSSKDHRHINTQRVRNMLFSGKKLTKRYLDHLLDVTNSGEIVNRLRKSGMNIVTTWKTSREGKRYGEYSWVPPVKQSRIANRSYMNQ